MRYISIIGLGENAVKQIKLQLMKCGEEIQINEEVKFTSIIKLAKIEKPALVVVDFNFIDKEGNSGIKLLEYDNLNILTLINDDFHKMLRRDDNTKGFILKKANLSDFI